MAETATTDSGDPLMHRPFKTSRALIVLSAALLAAACGEAPGADTSSAADAGDAPGEASDASAEPASAAAGAGIDLNGYIMEDARGVDMIPGEWAATPEECSSEFAVTFDAQTYRDSTGSGPWRAEGDTIIVDYSTDAIGTGGEPLVADVRLKVIDLQPGQMTWETGAGVVATVVLCN